MKDPPSPLPSPHDLDNASQLASSPQASDVPPQVLLVEDNPTDIFVAKETLEGCNLAIELHLAQTGNQAIALLDAIGGDPPFSPALILLDLNLPGVLGIDVLKAIRTHPKSSRIPVVIVTSSDSQQDRRAVERLGADGYFLKSTDLQAYDALGDLVCEILGKSPSAH